MFNYLTRQTLIRVIADLENNMLRATTANDVEAQLEITLLLDASWAALRERYAEDCRQPTASDLAPLMAANLHRQLAPLNKG